MLEDLIAVSLDPYQEWPSDNEAERAEQEARILKKWVHKDFFFGGANAYRALLKQTHWRNAPIEEVEKEVERYFSISKGFMKLGGNYRDLITFMLDPEPDLFNKEGYNTIRRDTARLIETWITMSGPTFVGRFDLMYIPNDGSKTPVVITNYAERLFREVGTDVERSLHIDQETGHRCVLLIAEINRAAYDCPTIRDIHDVIHSKYKDRLG